MKSHPAPVAVLLALLLASAPAFAKTEYTDAEIGYFAAKWQESEFAREDALCGRAYRKQLSAGRQAFEQSHPAYVAGLALASPRPELLEVTKRKLANYDALYQRMQPMMQAMAGSLCPEAAAGRATQDFDKRLASSRDILAKDEPPVPEPPLTTITPAEVESIVGIVLQHPQVAMYLHPDAPGRVPVRVALAAPHERIPLALSLYGARVETTGTADRRAVQLTIKPHGDHCKVEVKYEPEGIFGSVSLERAEGGWRATEAHIYE